MVASPRLGIGSGAVVAVTLVLVCLHFVLRLGLGMGPEAPDLLVVALLLHVRNVRFGTAACIGFALGLLEDAFALVAFGANIVAMTVVGMLGVQTRAFFVSTTSISFHIVYFVVGAWLRDFIHWTLRWMAGVTGGFVEPMVLGAVPAALYAALVGVVVLRLTSPFSEHEP